MLSALIQHRVDGEVQLAELQRDTASTETSAKKRMTTRMTRTSNSKKSAIHAEACLHAFFIM